MMLASHKTKETERIVGGWVKNLARPVFSNDTSLIKAIAAGKCDVGIVNSYYLARLQQQNPKLPVSIFWPNQKSSGVHVNISGAGVLRYTKKAKLAKQFLEWLSTPKAQNLFAELNHEFPVHKSVSPSAIVRRWGALSQVG